MCLFALAMFVDLQNKGDHSAPGSVGIALVFLSISVLFASPLLLRFARRRGLLAVSSITAAVLFLGTCGGGTTLIAAYPTQSPSPAVASRISQAASPPTSPASRSTPSKLVSPSASPTSSASSKTTPSPTPTSAAAPPPPPPSPAAAAPPPPPPAANTCGAPSNPWGYNFCGRGSYIYNPPQNFCSYFSPCVSTFWTSANGYVVQCVSGKWSHSGGVSGACSSNGGVSKILYSGP